MSTQSKRIVRAYLLLFVLLAALSFLSLAVGSVRVSAADILVALGGKEGTDMTRHILFDIRLPRMLAALILGGALSVSGFLLQTFFSNPIAGPFVLGISSGAKLAVSIFMILFLGQGLIMNSWVMIGAAFLGAMASMGFVLAVSKKLPQMSMLVVSGIMIGYICSAATDFIVTFADDSNIVNLHNWSMGSFSGISIDGVKICLLVTAAAFFCSMLLSKAMGAYQLGEVYARNMGVNIIPEFDMPGHSEAFVRTFRHDMQSPEGMKILKLLVDEVCETFDVPYLHIGTDEVRFTNPKFVPEMVEYVRAKGKKVISWNPGWHYKPGEIDMTHLWSYRGKAQKGIPAIDSKFHYLNHFDTFGDIIALYNSRIYNVEQGSDDIAGTILAIWNDRYVANERNIILENNFYPNMLAIAERAWKGGGTEYFDKNGTILPSEDSPEFKEFADFENRMLWHKEHTFKGYPFAYVKQTNVKWNITDAFPNGGDLNKVFPPEQELKDSYLYEGKEYGVHPAIGAGIYLRHVWGKMVPTFYKDPQENHTAYAYTWVYSPKDQEVGLWAEFQNYGRSEMDLAPLQGKWDYKGSRIWINNEEIQPPVWTATHRTKSNEIALGNENCVARPPIAVHLNKGWNKVFLKLPVGKFNMPEVRLVKWMFTTVFVTPDGENAVDGLIYSPDKTK